MAVVHYPAVGRPQRPVVSVCIANYNGEGLLLECIESVLAQEGNHAIEIIVHDDASVDGSVALLREHYPQVELLASPENVGFCVANNRMVVQARGDYVLLLNNDAALFPDAVATLLAFAHAQATPGILTLPQYDWETGTLVDRGCLLDPFYNPVPNLDPARRDVAYVIGACLWIPRVLWQELGGFPEWIESIGEDMYLCCHARLRAIPVQAIPSSGYRHQQGVSFGGNRVNSGKLQTTFRRRRLSERNKTFALVIFTPTLLVWPLLLGHLALMTIEAAMLLLARRQWQIVRGIYGNVLASLACNVGRLRLERRAMQHSRSATVRSILSGFTLSSRKLALLVQHGLPRIRH